MKVESQPCRDVTSRQGKAFYSQTVLATLLFPGEHSTRENSAESMRRAEETLMSGREGREQRLRLRYAFSRQWVKGSSQILEPRRPKQSISTVLSYSTSCWPEAGLSAPTGSRTKSDPGTLLADGGRVRECYSTDPAQN